MSALGRRTARLVAEARRRKAERHHQPQRITQVIVHLPAEPGDPFGEKVLVHAGIGRQPSIFHQYDRLAEAHDAEEASGA